MLKQLPDRLIYTTKTKKHIYSLAIFLQDRKCETLHDYSSYKPLLDIPKPNCIKTNLPITNKHWISEMDHDELLQELMAQCPDKSKEEIENWMKEIHIFD